MENIFCSFIIPTPTAFAASSWFKMRISTLENNFFIFSLGRES